jgi:putative secretion ATPase (PEP-CTERM system associated)
MYEQHYGLTGRPFQLTADPQFYFDSISHRKAMSYLGYGLSQAEGFIVITGEVGSGKSMQVAHLMERIDPAALTVAQIVTSALDGETIVQVVAQAFGLAVEGQDKAATLGVIEAFLHHEARAGRRCLLVVDECQNLDLTALEELRMLSNYQLGAQPLLQSLLLGQPEFRRTLAHHPGLEQLRQRIIASHHLDALGEDEVEHYVVHRLSHVGWNGHPGFEEGLIDALYQHTDGIPRRINQVMNRLLLLGAVEDSGELTLGMLEEVVAEMANDESGAADTAAAPALGFAELLAERDVRTAELEAAISELQAAGTGRVAAGEAEVSPLDAEIAAKLTRIEARLDEQEQSFRHVLAMLIEWLEEDPSREAA